MLIQQFQAPEDAPARVPGPTATTPTPEGPASTADAPGTGAATANPLPPAQPTPELPAPAVQAAPLQRPPSFLAFFIQHLRSDPQMRICAYSFVMSKDR
jgi:hypothetical protein